MYTPPIIIRARKRSLSSSVYEPDVQNALLHFQLIGLSIPLVAFCSAQKKLFVQLEIARYKLADFYIDNKSN